MISMILFGLDWEGRFLRLTSLRAIFQMKFHTLMGLYLHVETLEIVWNIENLMSFQVHKKKFKCIKIKWFFLIFFCVTAQWIFIERLLK